MLPTSTKPLAKLFLLLFITLFSLSAQMYAQGVFKTDTTDYTSELFDSNNVIPIQITADFKQLVRDDKDVRGYHTGKLRYALREGKTDSLDVLLKVRGNFRRKYCSFPPLKLKPIDTHLVKHPFFGTHGKLKLVTHCRAKSEAYEQFILQEYLVYRIYNIITDQSYRVRLVDITYMDTSGKLDTLNYYGFFIESTKMMLSRLQMTEVEVLRVPQHQIDRFTMGQVAVFQYFIANTDWSTSALHNIRLMRTDPFTPPIAVPYDFDWAGIINTPYAKPQPQVEIRDVRQRVYRGFCRTDEEFQAIFDVFNEKRDEIYNLYTQADFLTNKKRNAILKYIDRFYEIINDDYLIKKYIKSECMEQK